MNFPWHFTLTSRMGIIMAKDGTRYNRFNVPAYSSRKRTDHLRYEISYGDLRNIVNAMEEMRFPESMVLEI